VEDEIFHEIEHVWRYAHDPEAHVTRPEALTNAAVRSFRKSSAEKYIVHYVQPHAPFLHCVGKYDSVSDGAGGTQNIWDGLEEGEFKKNEVWGDYGQNLLTVLDNVLTLIEEFDGQIAITADHGNALGEFGYFGHPGHVPIPAIRKVPWATATGLSKENYDLKEREEVSTGSGEQDIKSELKDHLRDLGYVV